jgi:D-lyxose ketol-isomerase
VVNTDLYCGKKMFVTGGKKCSYHYHPLKDEAFHVLSGRLLVESISLLDASSLAHSRNISLPEAVLMASKETILAPGQSLRLPPKTCHRFTGLSDVEFIEFSTHHDDGDVVRIIPGD